MSTCHVSACPFLVALQTVGLRPALVHATLVNCQLVRVDACVEGILRPPGVHILLSSFLTKCTPTTITKKTKAGNSTAMLPMNCNLHCKVLQTDLNPHRLGVQISRLLDSAIHLPSPSFSFVHLSRCEALPCSFPPCCKPYSIVEINAGNRATRRRKHVPHTTIAPHYRLD
jgi:hypothetical protein